MTVRCTECGRFVPRDFLAINRWGDYGGGPLVDDTLCVPCGGPAGGSNAYYAQQVAALGLDPEIGLSPDQETQIAQWKTEDAHATQEKTP